MFFAFSQEFPQEQSARWNVHREPRPVWAVPFHLSRIAVRGAKQGHWAGHCAVWQEERTCVLISLLNINLLFYYIRNSG